MALAARLRRVTDVLQQQGHRVYCYQFQKQIDPTPAEALEAAIRELKACDAVLVIKSSERRSEGQLIEVGAALALGKRLIVAEHQSAVGTTYLPDLTKTSFVWSDEDSLLTGIKAVL